MLYVIAVLPVSLTTRVTNLLTPVVNEIADDAEPEVTFSTNTPSTYNLIVCDAAVGVTVKVDAVTPVNV